MSTNGENVKGARDTVAAAITIQRWWKMCKDRKIRSWLNSIESNLETIYERDEQQGEQQGKQGEQVVGRVSWYDQFMLFVNRLSLFWTNFIGKFNW